MNLNLESDVVLQKELLARRMAESSVRIVHIAGDSSAYQYAQIHTQWDERAAALEWLEKARRLSDPGLIYLKTDPLMDPLRNEPRSVVAIFPAIYAKISLACDSRANKRERWGNVGLPEAKTPVCAEVAMHDAFEAKVGDVCYRPPTSA
jgi:hypothetical protein